MTCMGMSGSPLRRAIRSWTAFADMSSLAAKMAAGGSGGAGGLAGLEGVVALCDVFLPDRKAELLQRGTVAFQPQTDGAVIRVAGATLGSLLKTRDTVLIETPASVATCLMFARPCFGVTWRSSAFKRRTSTR
jgi:hypothetical protein